MKKQIKTKLLTIAICSCLAIIFGAGAALADSTNVTVTWIIPGDTTLTVSFPTGEGKIEFDCVGMNFTEETPTGQTDSVSALRTSNNGNTAVSVYMYFADDIPTNVTFVNVSVGDNLNTSGKYYWTQANDTTSNQTLVASLAIGSSEDFWFWTTGSNVEETTGVDKTLRVGSLNV